MEATSQPKISDADLAKACWAGLAQAGSGTQDAAITAFADAIRAPLQAEIAAYGELMTKATATIAALHDAPPIGKKLTLTGLQVQYLHDFCGGEPDTELAISRFEAATCLDTGEAMPEGLYCWFEDYPEEGRIYLPEDADAALAVQAPPAEPTVQHLPADDTEGGAL